MFGLSDESTIAFAAVLVSGLIGLASLAFNFWNSSSERKHRAEEHTEDNREWYRRTLFEKRLEALQEGKVWLDRLWDSIYSPFADGRKVPLVDALDWYAKSVVYVHGEMPDKSPVGSFLYDCEWSMEQGDEMPKVNEWKRASDFIRDEANSLLGGLKS